MLTKPLVVIFSVGVILWAGHIMIAPDTKVRIERTCEPFNWSGRFVTSVTELTIDGEVENVKGFFSNLEQDCRYVVWNQFFAADRAKEDSKRADIERQLKDAIIQREALRKSLEGNTDGRR